VAHRLGTEIVSADSRQVYRGLDIGTGKDLSEYAIVDPPVPYHLIDVAEPTETYTVFRYQRDCYDLFEKKQRDPSFPEDRPLLMVGGTGLFAEAVLRGYRIPNVPEDPWFRERAEARELDELLEELRDLDEERLRRTDCSSKRRVIRALEIARHARRGPVVVSPPPPVRIDFAVFVVRIEPDVLRRRIDRRLEERLAEGLIEEVRGLMDAGVEASRLMKLGLEYREAASYLVGEKSRERMVEDLRHGIHKFAKRQRTWFRGLERRGVEVTTIGPEDAEALLSHPLAAG
jgi:tRNA dimethylallyltransferase